MAFCLVLTFGSSFPREPGCFGDDVDIVYDSDEEFPLALTCFFLFILPLPLPLPPIVSFVKYHLCPLYSRLALTLVKIGF